VAAGGVSGWGTPGLDGTWLPAWLRGAWLMPGVTDLVVHGAGEVWIDRGEGWERWHPPADAGPVSAGTVRETAVRLAAWGGRRLDDAMPMADARMPDGSRLHAVLEPVAQGGTALSLRAVRMQALTWEDLVTAGTLHPHVAALIAALVRERASLLITGATGAGKTTLLASALSLVDPRERIVVIEESGEVMPAHPHVVRLVERRPNVDGVGAVSLSTLVREALRMRPDRMVLGECRGAEVREVMLALNTGHRGGLATLHANSVEDVPARLMGLASLADMSPRAAAMHAGAAFDAVIHVVREGGRRRVAQVGVLECGADGELRVRRALHVDSAGVLHRDQAADALWRVAGDGASAAG